MPQLPAPAPWAPGPGEQHAAIKSLATTAVQALASYPYEGGTVPAAQARLQAAGLPASLADGAGSLLEPGVASAATIVYPQIGGLTDSAASVMVVAEMERKGRTGPSRRESRTIDVRVTRSAGKWAVQAIAADGTRPPGSNVPDRAVDALVGNPRVRLPGSAIADLRAGATDPRVVQLLQALAERWELDVTVLATGHPPNVFETSRTSNHTAGRGVDIWAVDGVPVIEQRESAALRAVVARALELGATEIGAPFDTDGRGGKVFTNAVHLDHLHLAFRS